MRKGAQNGLHKKFLDLSFRRKAFRKPETHCSNNYIHSTVPRLSRSLAVLSHCTCRFSARLDCGTEAGFSPNTSLSSRQYDSTIAPQPFIHLLPTLCNLSTSQCRETKHSKTQQGENFSRSWFLVSLPLSNSHACVRRKLLNWTFHALWPVRNYVVPYSTCGLL